MILFLTERESAAAAQLSGSSLDGNAKSGRGSEGGRGGRKKYLSFLFMLKEVFLMYLFGSCHLDIIYFTWLLSFLSLLLINRLLSFVGCLIIIVGHNIVM